MKMVFQYLSLKGKVEFLFFLFASFSHVCTTGRKLKPQMPKASCQMIRVTDTEAGKWIQIDKEQSNRSGFRQGSRTCLEEGAIVNGSAGICCHFFKIIGIL